MYGNKGADLLSGGAGADILYGNHGIDTLLGGAGNDTMYGGDGADVFQVAAGSGVDTIDGFDVTEDKIRIPQFVNDSSIINVSFVLDSLGTANNGADAEVVLGTSHQIVLLGVNGSSLSASNFEVF